MNLRDKKAIAVKYTETMHAPYVIAKSKGHLTKVLLELAEKHNIMVLKQEQLLEQVFEIPLGVIPEKYYDIFAELLAFVYHLQDRE